MSNDSSIFNDQRPSPDALLEHAKNEGRGRLKIFFGAAPGVGKTYAMLSSAQEHKENGGDVVIGIVETHGRAETQDLVNGLEIIPRKKIPYKGHVLEEMDIDGIIARKPKLVLIDELAHTNAPGSRHPKRYQDVEEVLANGIDVYSTMNVQHLESLNDVVAQITRVRVRETVPDAILENADITLVDLSPQELIDRLRDGKVYVPEQAQKAIQHFFAPGNLTALRELALRATAERVDDQMVQYMQTHAIKGPWPAGERVLVCVNQNPISPKLIRSAKRSAERLHAPWTAAYVETERHHRMTPDERDAVNDALRLAERLGADVVRLTGSNAGDEIVKYALQNNVTRIVLGNSRRSAWHKKIVGNLCDDILQKVDGIDIMIVSGVDDAAINPIMGWGKKRQPEFIKNQFWPYVVIIALILMVTGLNQYLRDAVNYKNTLMLYLLPVMIAAVQFGLWPSLMASFLSIVFYKLFFSENSLLMNLPNPGDFASMLLFLFVAILASNLAARVSMQASTATRRAKMTAALYEFSRKLAGIGSLHDLLFAVVTHIANTMKVKTALLLPQDGRLNLRAAYPAEFQLNDGEMSAAAWCFDNSKPAGMDTETLQSLDRLFLPLNTAEGTVGVLVIYPENGQSLERDEQKLLNALADQAAIAIERMEYSINMAKSQLRRLSDRLSQGLDRP